MYKNILVPIDLAHEDVSERILRLAKSLADAGARVTALHIVPDIPAYADTYVPEDVRAGRAGVTRKALEELAASAGLGGSDVRVATGTPHVRILDIVDELGPDLVIIGSHKPGLSDYFLGSTAARVVRHAPCSVLVDR